MKLRRYKKALWIFALLALILSAVFLYGLVEPQTPIGNAVFHFSYALTPTRPAFLKCYNRFLNSDNGGYIPRSIDNFLVDRLETSGGTAEADQIVDFLVRQPPSRWGLIARTSDDALKKTTISTIIRRLDSYSDREATAALVLVEELRTEVRIGKGGFDRSKPDAFDLTTAKKLFTKWWSNGKNWPSIKTIDPLATSKMVIIPGP